MEDLKFDDLKTVLRLRTEADGSLAAVAEEDVGQFDAVVGNPPWTGHNSAAKKRWVANTSESLLKRLGSESEAFDLPDANPDLPFLWRAGEWVKPGGQIALIIHARWLFGISPRSFNARRWIFTAFNVTGVLNGAALRRTKVWPGISDPFSLVFARNEPAPASGALQFVSPFVEAGDTRDQTVLRVDWADAKAVPHEEICSIPWTLKSRFRGDELAHRAFEAVRSAGIPLSDYLSALKPGLQFWNGYQVGGKAGKQVSAEHMRGMPDLKGSVADTFVLNTSALPEFLRKTLLFSRDPAIYEAPLLLVRKSIPADPLEPRSMRADARVAFHESFHGLSLKGVVRGGDHARLLQILLQSRLGIFVSLMTDALYGVERETPYKESFDPFPIIPLDCLSKDQLAQMRRLSKALENGLDQPLYEALNTFVFDLYGLDMVERAAIDDSLDTRGPTPAAVTRAVTPPTDAERSRFLVALKESLDDVLQASDLMATVNDVSTGCIPWRVLSVATGANVTSKVPMDELLKAADESGASLIVLPMSPSHVFVGLPDRYRYWTPTQAALLAHNLLGGPLGDA